MTMIYLASASPRRRELLAQVGVTFEVLAQDIDESVWPGEAPNAYVARLARQKAEAAAREIRARGLPPRPVLAADTTVVAKDAILGKPADGADAARMLRLLSGGAHDVLTGVAVAVGERLETAVSASQVRFTELSEARIARYVATGEPMGKAGAYGIQGTAAAFIENITGSYSGIMGLPLFETVELLSRFGVEAI